MTTRPRGSTAADQADRAEDAPIAEADLAAHLAHELRNPLAGIRIACRNLLRESADPALRARLGPIIEEVDRLIGTVNRHLGCARQAAEPPRRFRLAALLEGIHRLTWPQVPQHIRITVCVPEHLICTLPEMGLRRALWNLITNAWQALGNQAGEVIITAEAREGQLHITVADTGPGLPQEMLQGLPRAPMTTKPEGSGLGLLQVRGYVEALGGQLLLANRTGGGAEITLIIPCEHALCEFQAGSGTPG